VEDLGVVGRMILEWTLDNWGGEGVRWILLVQIRGQWQALLNIVINLQVP